MSTDYCKNIPCDMPVIRYRLIRSIVDRLCCVRKNVRRENKEYREWYEKRKPGYELEEKGTMVVIKSLTRENAMRPHRYDFIFRKDWGHVYVGPASTPEDLFHEMDSILPEKLRWDDKFSMSWDGRDGREIAYTYPVRGEIFLFCSGIIKDALNVYATGRDLSVAYYFDGETDCKLPTASLNARKPNYGGSLHWEFILLERDRAESESDRRENAIHERKGRNTYLHAYLNPFDPGKSYFAFPSGPFADSRFPLSEKGIGDLLVAVDAEHGSREEKK